jgi:hypothetical protein
VETIDPYRPDATPDDRADHIVNALLTDGDPVRRYATIKALHAGRLRDAAVLTLRQLRQERGSTEAAAKAVGISRQSAQELLRKAGAPGAREERGVRDTPAYAYGEYLASVQDIAYRFRDEKDRDWALTQWYDLETKAVQSLAGFPDVAKTGACWVHKLRTSESHPYAAHNAAARMDKYIGRIADWVREHGDNPRLSSDEQAAAYIGIHHARARWRKEREERSTT